MEQRKLPVNFSSWKCIRTTKVSFNLKSRETERKRDLVSEGAWNKTYSHWTWLLCFTKQPSWFSVYRSRLLWSMSSQQWKQPCTPPPPPQQQQVKQPCQAPPHDPFVPITKEPCNTKLQQPGNTKLPEPSCSKYSEPGHPTVPEPGHTKFPEPDHPKVPQPGQTKVKEPSPSTIIPGSSQKTKQNWCGSQPCSWEAMPLRRYHLELLTAGWWLPSPLLLLCLHCIDFIISIFSPWLIFSLLFAS